MRATIVITLALVGCVTVSPEAARVQLHDSTSTVIATCKRLGSVSAEGSRAISIDHAHETARVAMREQAYRQYQADSVALVNVDTFWNKVVAQGVAYRCF